MSDTLPNEGSPSTTFAWRRVKITAPPRPHSTARAKRAPMALETPKYWRPGPLPRKVTGVLVKYRGGDECFWELSHAGRTVRCPGWWNLQDALTHLFQGLSENPD